MCEKGLLLLSVRPSDGQKEMVWWGRGWTDTRTASCRQDPAEPEGGTQRERRQQTTAVAVTALEMSEAQCRSVSGCVHSERTT